MHVALPYEAQTWARFGAKPLSPNDFSSFWALEKAANVYNTSGGGSMVILPVRGHGQ